MKTLFVCVGCFLLFLIMVVSSMEIRSQPNLSATINATTNCQQYGCATPVYSSGWPSAFR